MSKTYFPQTNKYLFITTIYFFTAIWVHLKRSQQVIHLHRTQESTINFKELAFFLLLKTKRWTATGYCCWRRQVHSNQSASDMQEVTPIHFSSIPITQLLLQNLKLLVHVPLHGQPHTQVIFIAAQQNITRRHCSM